jgi:hypothetical protein
MRKPSHSLPTNGITPIFSRPAERQNNPAMKRKTTHQDKTAFSRQDAIRISIKQDYDLKYWSEKLGCSAQRLQQALQTIGTLKPAAQKEILRLNSIH